MARILIIGIGNPLRCDDGVAWRVAGELSAQGLPNGVEIITQHQLTPELAFPASQAETILFLDAARDGQAGELRCSPINAQHESSIFTHEFSPGAIVRLAQDLYGKHPRAFMVSLGGECFDHGEALSSRVEQNVPRAVSFFRKLLTNGINSQNLVPTHG